MNEKIIELYEQCKDRYEEITDFFPQDSFAAKREVATILEKLFKILQEEDEEFTM